MPENTEVKGGAGFGIRPKYTVKRNFFSVGSESCSQLRWRGWRYSPHWIIMHFHSSNPSSLRIDFFSSFKISWFFEHPLRQNGDRSNSSHRCWAQCSSAFLGNCKSVRSKSLFTCAFIFQSSYFISWVCSFFFPPSFPQPHLPSYNLFSISHLFDKPNNPPHPLFLLHLPHKQMNDQHVEPL